MSVKPVLELPAAPDPESVAALVAELSLPEPIASILANRGFADPGSARDFLRPRLEQLLDPWQMAGMAEAVDRITAAIDRGEPILVHGDYDVDGVCGSAMLVRALRELGARAEPFVPHRLKDGYDFGPAGLAAAVQLKAGCVLTCDCGTMAHQTIAAARSEGIDVVVTDHHTPPEVLPPAAAVLNPHRPDCSYPEKVLCGAGVAFKLLQALFERHGRSLRDLYKYLDLVAVPTIADLVPLTGENRTLARFGLKVLRRTPNAGFRALLHSSGLSGRPISAGQISFILAPRLNAVGRMGEALRGVELLLLDDDRKAASLAQAVEAENRYRQEVDRRTLEEVKERLEAEYDPAVQRAIVLASDRWHPGVIGIVASRVVEEFYRPTFLIALDGESGRGSGRSIRGFHLFEALKACEEHLERFGGHRYAAGLQIRRDRVDAFRDALDARAHEVLGLDDLRPRLPIDLELPIEVVSPEIWRFLTHFGPFGQGNPTPTFLARNVRLRGEPKIVGEEHLRVLWEGGDGAVHQGIAFRQAAEADWLEDAKSVDLAFRLRSAEWQGVEYLEAQIVDLRPSEAACAVSES